MTTDWSKVKHFKPSEFTYPDQLDPLLITALTRSGMRQADRSKLTATTDRATLGNTV